MGGGLCARTDLKINLRLIQPLKVSHFSHDFPQLCMVQKLEHFLRGEHPPWPPQKNAVSQKKNEKLIFAPNPQFVFYNLKVI